MMDNDVRKSTKKVYESRCEHFKDYCTDVGVNPIDCPVEVVINFLTILRRVLGYQYQTICGYRSAIARFHKGADSVSIGSLKSIKRLTRACFIEKPPLPRYSDIWDVSQLLRYLEGQSPNSSLSVYDLGVKTLALLAVQSISRQGTTKYIIATPDGLT